MWQIILATWKTGLRSRYFYGVALLAVLLVITAYLASSFSPRAPRTVALDVGLSGLRISLVLLGLLWVQEAFSREVDRKTVQLLLSYPLRRGDYLMGRFFGVVSLSAVAAVALTLALIIAAVAAGLQYEAQQYLPSLGVALWVAVFDVWLESVVVVAFTVFMSAISTTPMLPFVAGAGFAMAGEGLGTALEYVLAGGDRSLSAANTPILQAIHWLLPDLSRLDWRLWPMYQTVPDPQSVLWAIVSALCYTGVLVALAVWAFSRREFS